MLASNFGSGTIHTVDSGNAVYGKKLFDVISGTKVCDVVQGTKIYDVVRGTKLHDVVRGTKQGDRICGTKTGFTVQGTKVGILVRGKKVGIMVRGNKVGIVVQGVQVKDTRGVNTTDTNVNNVNDVQSDMYDGIQYNVKVAQNRFQVLHDCTDVDAHVGDDGISADVSRQFLPKAASQRRRQTGSSARGRQMSTSGGRRPDPAWAPDDTRGHGGEGALKHEGGGRHVINAVMAWSTPTGTVDLHALGDLNSVPIAIKNRTCRAMLDTGASINCIRRTWAQDLGLSRYIHNTHVREVRDAQGKNMQIYGDLKVPVVIGDTELDVNCVVVEKLPLPVILGVPFLEQTNARLDYGDRTMILSDCIASLTSITTTTRATVPLTPLTENTLTFHSTEQVLLQPSSEVMIKCKVRINKPYARVSGPNDRLDCGALEVLKSELLFASKSLIVKPTTVYRQENGTYWISVINPLSKIVMLDAGEHITDGKVKEFAKYEPPSELPEGVYILPESPLNEPLQVGDSQADGRTGNVSAIQILWPPQPYCPPVQVDSHTEHGRTVGCQSEVDIGNQTRIQTFKPLDWDDLLKLEPKAEPYRDKLMEILDRHRPAFAADLNELAVMEGVYYRIDLIADATPVNRRAFRMSPAHEEELDRQLQKLKDANVIQESAGSLWGSPAFVVFKHDKEGNPIKPRLVIDFYHTNKMIVGVKSPIPKVDEIIDHIAAGRNKVFSVVDLASAFYAIQLTPDSREICAINTRTKKYCFNRIPMGSKSSPEVFSSLMSRCLSPLDQNKVMNYMDDLLIMTDTVEEHLEVLDQLFWRLRQVGLRISPTKVNFLQSSVKYLGYIFNKDGVKADPEKMEALIKLPAPKDVKGVRTLMGCINYYRRFVKDFSKIANPINELLKKDEPFVWTERRQLALDTLKAALLKNAVLYAPDPNKPFILCLDASDYAIGGVVSQKSDDGLERPCVLMSKTLNECQSKYHSNEKEALALVESLKMCETIMGPNPSIEVYSDNLTAVYLASLAAKTGKLFRYKMFLNRFDIKVQHKEGKLNCVADMLSRLRYEGQPVVDDEEEPDTHALIMEAHCPFDDILTGQTDKGPRTVYAVQDSQGFPGVKEVPKAPRFDEQGRPERRPFCMFDRFEDYNFPEDEPRLGRAPSPESVQESEHRQNESINQGNMQQADVELEVDATDTPYYAQDEDDEGVDERQWEGDDQADRGADKLTDKVDEFMQDENGLFFDDWEQIQNQQVLDIYSYVLKNTRLLASEQSTDQDSADLYQYKDDKTLPGPMNRAKRVMAEEDRYLLTLKGILYRKFQPYPGHKMCHQLVLPAKYRFRITSLFHHGLHGSHRGFHSLLHLVRRRFYWKNMDDDLVKYVNSCSHCAAGKRDFSHVRTPLHLRKQCKPLEVCHMDVLKISPTRGGELKVLVMVDRFTKHFEVECIPDEKSSTLARILLTSWIHRYGTPRVVILDRAAAHLSEVFKALAEQFNIKLNYIVGYRPQSNSAVERVHSKILNSLRACLREYPTRPWPSFLSHIRWSHDMSVQTHGFSPYELLHGFECSMSGNLEIEPPALEVGDPQDVLEFLWPDLAFMRTAAAKNAREEAENMKARYDKRHKTKYKGFRPGDLVWLAEIKPRVPSQYKIVPRKKGPYVIVSSPLPGFWLLRLHNEIINQLYPEERLSHYVKETESRLRCGRLEERGGVHHDQRQAQGTGAQAQTVREAVTNRQADRQVPRQDGDRVRQDVQDRPLGRQNKQRGGQKQKERAEGRDVSEQIEVPDRSQTRARQPERASQDGQKGTHSQRDRHTHTHSRVSAPTSAHTPPSDHAQAPVHAPDSAHSQGCARTRAYCPPSTENCTREHRGAHPAARGAQTGAHSGAHSDIEQGAHSSARQASNGQAQAHTDAHTHVQQGNDIHSDDDDSVTARKVTTAPAAKRAVKQTIPSDTKVYNNPQTRYELRKRHPMTGQVSGEIKKERKDSLSSTSEEEGADENVDDRESCRSSDSEYLPDIPPVKKRRKVPVRAKKDTSDNVTHSFMVKQSRQGSQGQGSEQEDAHKAGSLEHEHDESVQRQGQKRKSPHSESDIYGKLMTGAKERNGDNTGMMTAARASQHVLTTKNAHRHSGVNKHVGSSDDGRVQLGNSTHRPKKLDWTKLKKIITSKSLVNGTSYLCGWMNRAPQWVKGTLIPEHIVTDFEKRIRHRKIMQQLNRAYGNMN